MRHLISIFLVVILLVGSLAVLGYGTYVAMSGTSTRVARIWTKVIAKDTSLRLCQGEPYGADQEEVKALWHNHIAVVLQYLENENCLYIAERFSVQRPEKRKTLSGIILDDSPGRLPSASGGYFR